MKVVSEGLRLCEIDTHGCVIHPIHGISIRFCPSQLAPSHWICFRSMMIDGMQSQRYCKIGTGGKKAAVDYVFCMVRDFSEIPACVFSGRERTVAKRGGLSALSGFA